VGVLLSLQKSMATPNSPRSILTRRNGALSFNQQIGTLMRTEGGGSPSVRFLFYPRLRPTNSFNFAAFRQLITSPAVAQARWATKIPNCI
jgi:hypothetical protein